MKIAINTRFLKKERMEGVGWYTYEICRRMVADHPEDSFYFLFDRPYHPEFIFAENVTPIVLSPPARHPILFYIWFEYSVKKALQKIKPDVFFSPDGFLCLGSRVTSFITIHDIAHFHYPEFIPWMMRKYYGYFMPKFVAKAKKIFTVSEFSKQDIVKSYNLPKNKVRVFYNGSREAFRPLMKPEIQATKAKYSGGQDYFICIGSIHPRKNIERAIRAFIQYKNLSKRDDKLILVGRMAWKAGEVKKLIEEQIAKNNIVLSGNVSDEELVNLLGSSDALIYPSIFEGFGIPLIEAMKCGIPVICSNRSSLPEVGGKAVVYVDPYSVDSICSGILEVRNNPKLVKELLLNSKKQILKFDYEKSAKGIYDSFKE